MNNDEAWDSYFIKGTDVFKNNLGITEKTELLQKEVDISFERVVELYENPIEGNFDSKHYKDIHYYIFKDIYPFAGVYRSCSMTKRDFTYYVSPKMIGLYLDDTLRLMKEDILKCHTKSDYVSFLAEYYNELYKIHPFREGNSRTLREFLREFVLKFMPDYELSWTTVTHEELYDAIFETKYYNRSNLEAIFTKALVLKEDNISRR